MPYNDHRDSRRLPRRRLGYKFGHFDGCPARAGRLDLARVSRLQMPSSRTRNTLPEQGLLLRTEYSSLAPFALYRRLPSQ